MTGKNNAILKLLAVTAFFLSCSMAKQADKTEVMNENKPTGAKNKSKPDTVKTEYKPVEFLDSLLTTYPQYFDELLKTRQR